VFENIINSLIALALRDGYRYSLLNYNQKCGRNIATQFTHTFSRELGLHE